MFWHMLFEDDSVEPSPAEISEAHAAAERAQAAGRPGPDHLQLWIDGDINRPVYDRLKAQIDAAPCAKSIELVINSPGGDIWPVIDAYIVIRRHPAAVKRARLLDHCESGALVVAMACDERIASPETHVLLHPSSVDISQVYGERWTGTRLVEQAQQCLSIDDDIIRLIAARTGADVERLRAEASDERISTLDWCLENRIVTEIDDDAEVRAA